MQIEEVESVPSESDPSVGRSGRRIPWWMAVVGLSYLVTFILSLYLIVWGPAELKGFVSAFPGNAMMIRSVTAESEVAKGGLHAGDLVLMIDNRSVRSVRDWTEATGNLQAFHPQRWVVSRGGERLTLEIIPLRGSFRSRLMEGYLQYLSLLIPGFLLGLFIAWKRPADSVGRIGAWFIITASIAFGFPVGWAVLWRALPSAIQWLLWIPQLSRFVLEGIFISFFLLFPSRIVTRGWVWVAIWIPVLATLPWRIKAFYGVIHPGTFSPVPGWILTAGVLRTTLYLLLGIIIIAVSYRRFLDNNGKRRLRVLMAGTAVSLVSAGIVLFFDSFMGRMTGPGLRLLLFLAFPFNVVFPSVFAYAILRHRVLDISVILRQGLQYAFARGAVLGFVPALGALFVFDLAVNRQQSIADIFRSRGWVYSVLAGVCLVAYWKRREWLESIDRHFFRERYSAEKILRQVLAEIRDTQDLQSAAVRVVQSIETALHPEFAAAMVRPAEEPVYRVLAQAPSGFPLPPLPGGSKLVALLRVLGKPLEVLHGQSGWLDQRLPREEMEFARRSRIDLLVPVATESGRTEALLALGIKRSEEPYTREDQELLETIASSLALLLAQPASRAEWPSARLQECPKCGLCYDSATVACRADDVNLISVPVPCVLAGRYRLDRRLGKGGMGTVYEATDSALERRVAVKLIRDDWVGSLEAAHRFRREARAAAGFAHPNVVTIYDYGVEAETRAFLVMELMRGSTLRDEIARNKRLAPSRILYILRGVCAAVEAAHQHHLVHRDLKPENIFIAESAESIRETIKVLDFGVAKFLPERSDTAVTQVTATTNAGVLVGTPAYMAPEEWLGGELDVLWDVWALAVVAYEALTGVLPFPATSPGDLRQAVISGRFIPVSQHLEDPPERWQDFFTRSFAFDRAKRPQSAADFLDQLEWAMS